MPASLSPPPWPWLEPSTTAAEVFLWGQEHWEYSTEAVVYGGMGYNG
jgi:hypothetical protein